MNPEKDGQTQEGGTKARKRENDGKLQTKEHEYYINLPSFGKKGPSKLRQQFNKGMTAFIVIVTCILFFFAISYLSRFVFYFSIPQSCVNEK